MGFLANKICHATSGKAIVALQAEYPIIDSGFIISAGTITFTAPNTFTIAMRTIGVNNNTINNGNKAITLAICDPAIPIYPGTVFDPIVGAAFWSWAMTFVLGLFLISKNAKTILNAVKRF